VSGYAELLEPVKAIATQAGDAIIRIYENNFCVEQKPDHSPVTEADYVAHNIIVDGLAALTPEWPVLSEEGELPDYEIRRHWQRYWLVDPLDGTREFIKCNGEFTVNIALIENGAPVLGVIQVPVTREIYSAVSGCGAFHQNDGEAAEKIGVQQWDGKYITIAGSRSHRTPLFSAFLENFDDCHVLSLGSSLKSCYVAQGKADLYARFGPTCEWDTAAAQCIVEAAGGQLTDLDLQPLRYNSKESLINPFFFTFGDRRHDWRRFVPRELRRH
jgi:3'(2'), 5'-bisphosphate nucleotidase